MQLKRYKISDVAKLLSMTPEAIRYYESRGVINPCRDASSGYRYYSGWDIHLLIRSKIYRSYEYSLEETAGLISREDAFGAIQDFQDQAERLREEIKRKQAALSHLEEESGCVFAAKELVGSCREELRPAIYRLETQRGYTMYPDDERQKRLQHWIQQAPFVFSSTMFARENVGVKSAEFTVGLGILEKNLPFTGIQPDAYLQYYPSVPSVVTCIETTSADSISPALMQPAMEYMREHGLTLCGDVITRSVVMHKVNNEYCHYQLAWLPFEKR